MRAHLDDGTRIEVYFTAKGDGKSSVTVQVVGLPDRETVDALKVVWAKRLEAMKKLVAG